ncbi:MAG: hypothetical protein RI897_3628 [Verrucomicrobiota bacterium]
MGGSGLSMSDAELIQELGGMLSECLLPDQVRLGACLAHVLRARREGRVVPAHWARWLGRARASRAARERRAGLVGCVSYPEELPVSGRREEIVGLLRRSQVVVVAGETGSGKTTQLPKMCLEAGLGVRGRIGCTQPRRVAALSIARRLAEELGVEYGQGVGSKIRFNEQVSDVTSIKVMTDGILLMEVQRDPLLSEYDAILIDEAHERSLNIDFLLGHLRGLLERRDDLKVVVTSATIDTARFAEAFGGAPVVEVSGRMYPVEVRYRAPQVADDDDEHEGETYVEAAVGAVQDLACESHEGDVLVFMPGERDIREVGDRLRRVMGDVWDVVPLFGRLSNAEQDAIFHPGYRRRVVVSTNIAETSLTVPRIRYVVDAGLARVSRYHAGTRCRRLPVEAVARSNADQRKGRCGRLGPGVCVRLYSEEDYLGRPAFADAEIVRCNLADVVLRLKAFRLGEVETFPFIDPPPPAAIRGAYALLQELGALDEARELTVLGRELARLPVDPAIGRMLLEARKEGAVREVLVIAAGLSIQDPRERPLDKRDEAERAHRRFADGESDFVSLLKIWEAYHDTWESLKTQSQLRRFCREHFLSFLRMREWVDVHGQLEGAMRDLGVEVGGRLGERGSYEAIHRSLLAGLVGHVAQRKEANAYRLAGERLVHVFPGSGLFRKVERVKKGIRGGKAPEAEGEAGRVKQPQWLLAGEVVETSRLFARTLAGMDPLWVERVAPHVVRKSVVNPRWDEVGGRVVATERVLLRGLVLHERRVDYGRSNPEEAKEIFIREALMPLEGGLGLGFRDANRQLVEKVEFWQTGLPRRVMPDLAEALAGFYRERLPAVSSVHDLNRFLRGAGNRDRLVALPADLLGENVGLFSEDGLPSELRVGSETVPLRYAYVPGEERDGVTVRLSAVLAEVVDVGMLEWAVPALREQRLLALLRGLPKSIRRPLMPLDATARRILEEVPVEGRDFLGRVARYLLERHGLEVAGIQWDLSVLPAHLRPRFEVGGLKGGKVMAGRDLKALVGGIRKEMAKAQGDVWGEVVGRWERESLEDWTFGDVEAGIVVGEVGGLPVRAFAGLRVSGGRVDLRMFREEHEAVTASMAGVPRLAEKVIGRELGWVQRDLRELRRVQVLYSTLGSMEELLESAWEHVRRYVLPSVRWVELRESRFREYVEGARGRVTGVVSELVKRVEAVLEQRQEALMCKRPLPGMEALVGRLVPRQFLSVTPWERLVHVPRYLRALVLRAERAALNPLKDREKAVRVEPYDRMVSELVRKGSGDREKLVEFWWLMEEYRVSVFAQELGTAEKVSPKRLEELAAAVRAG